MSYEQGQRVIATYADGRTEGGTVAYVRMGGPTYDRVQAVSVILDSQRGRLAYVGSIFPADSVRAEDGS